MNLTITDFEKWLHVAALEIIYWGAMQPHEMTDDFYNVAYDHKNQNYSAHLISNKKFDPRILEMPDNPLYDILPLNEDDFIANCRGDNYNFGIAHEDGFTLQALIKGISKLFIEILERSSIK